MRKFSASAGVDPGRSGNEIADMAPNTARDEATVDTVESKILEDERITGVSGQCFIAAFPGKNYFDAFASQLSDEEKRNAGRPDDWLVFMPNKVGESAKKIFAADEHLVVYRIEMLGHSPGVGQLAVGLFGIPDRKCLDGPAPDFRHQCGDGARVEAAAEKYAERHIAHEVALHRSFEQVAITFDVVALIVRLLFGTQLQIPVLLDAWVATLVYFEPMSGH